MSCTLKGLEDKSPEFPLILFLTIDRRKYVKPLWRFYPPVAFFPPILNAMKNVKIILLSTALVVLTLLSACSSGFSASTYDFDVALNPSPLGWTNVDGVITVPSHVLTFNSKAGSIGATIEGYHIEYLDSSGNNAFPGDSVQFSEGTLNVRVPPGIRCPPSAEGQVDECTVNTPGVIFARGEPALSAETVMLPISVIAQLEAVLATGGAVGATANVTFYGTDDAQRPFVSRSYQFAIVTPR